MDRLLHEKYSELTWRERGMMQGVAFGINWFLDGLHWVGYLAMVAGTYSSGVAMWARVVAVGWGLSQVGFHLYWTSKLSVLKRRELVQGPEERLGSLMRMIDDVGDLQPLLESWLLQRPLGQIGVEYFLEWLVWITFDKPVEKLTLEEEKEVAGYMQILEQRLGSSRGEVQACFTMRPSIDKFKMEVLPLVVYLMVGFERHQVNDVRYLHRRPIKEDGTPIMFIHGISAGFVPYVWMLTKLTKKFPNRQIILLEVPHIAMELTTTIPGRDETLEAIDAILLKHAIKSFSLSAHSFGTLIASWIIRNRPHQVAKVSLVDPVCFRIWDPTLAHNFLYAKPISFMHDIIRNFVTKEYLIAHSVSKEVYWSQMVLFPADIKMPSTIFISTKDWVIHPTNIYNYLKPSLNIHTFNTFHGGFGFNSNYTQSFLDSL